MNDTISIASDHKSGLHGQTVLVTRPSGQAADLATKIESMGGRSIVCPVIEIKPPESSGPVEAAIESLPGYDLAVFASRNGVEFFDRQLKIASDRIPADLEIAAIGSSTAEMIREKWGIEAMSPNRANSHGLADFLVENFEGSKLLLVRGDRGSGILAERLARAEIEFDSVVAYRSVDIVKPNAEVVGLFESGKIDWVTATSSSIGTATVRLFGDWLVGGADELTAGRAKLVSISPTTSAAIRSVGGEPVAEAVDYNLDGLIAAMLRGGRSR